MLRRSVAVLVLFLLIVAVQSASGQTGSGNKGWGKDIGMPIDAGMTVSGDQMYVITDGIDWSSGTWSISELHKVDIASGAVNWSSVINGSLYEIARPVVAGQTVVVASSTGWLHGYDAADGDLEWSYDLGSVDMTSSPIYKNGKLFVASYDTVYCLDITSSPTETWSMEIGDIYRSSLLFKNDILYIGLMNGTLVSLDADLGTVIWWTELGGEIVSDPVWFESGGTGGTDVVILTTRIKVSGNFTGSKLHWVKPTGTVDNEIDIALTDQSPYIRAGKVYIGSSTGKLLCYDSSGTKKWEYDAGGPIAAGLTSINDTIYGGTNEDNGTIFAVRDTGDSALELWTHTPIPGSRIFATPAVADGFLVVGSDNGHLFAIDEEPASNPSVTSSGIVRNYNRPLEGARVIIEVFVTNSGSGNAMNVTVTFSVDGKQHSLAVIDVGAGDMASAMFTWTAEKGAHTLSAVVTIDGTEIDTGDNEAQVNVDVQKAAPTEEDETTVYVFIGILLIIWIVLLVGATVLRKTVFSGGEEPEVIEAEPSPDVDELEDDELEEPEGPDAEPEVEPEPEEAPEPEAEPEPEEPPEPEPEEAPPEKAAPKGPAPKPKKKGKKASTKEKPAEKEDSIDDFDKKMAELEKDLLGGD